MIEDNTTLSQAQSINEAVSTMTSSTEEHYSDLIDQSLKQIEAIIVAMRRNQEEIDALKAETRAMLRELQAA